MKYFFNDLVLIQLLIKKNSPMKKLFLPIFAYIFSVTMFAQTAGTLSVTFTTKASPTANYGTKNLVAVWIGTSANAFVKTVIGATGSNTGDLTNWKTLATKNIVNAVTSATRSNYGTVTGTWTGINTSNVLQPDANYKVNIEVTDDDGTPAGGYQSYSFAKGTTDVTLNTPNVGNFTGISIKWVHVSATAINDVEMEKYYSVYPNPAVSSIYVSGEDVKEVQICSLNGQILMTSNDQSVNISKLAKGNYLAVIRAKNGTVVKKIQKL